MNDKKTNWVLVIGAIILGLILLNALFLLGSGLIGLVFNLIGGLLKLIFSKAGMVVIGVALIVYIINNRSRPHTYQ